MEKINSAPEGVIDNSAEARVQQIMKPPVSGMDVYQIKTYDRKMEV